MTEAVQEKVMAEWSTEEKTNLVSTYGCELLIENASYDQLHDKSYPTDAFQVKYKVNDRVQTDLCRGKRVDVFDLYYDKFGKGSLISIDWGYGQVSPKLWGYKKSEGKKKKK